MGCPKYCCILNKGNKLYSLSFGQSIGGNLLHGSIWRSAHQINLYIALSAWQHFTGGLLLTVLHCALCNALVVQLCREQFPIALCLRQNALSVSALLLCVVDIETCRLSRHAAGGFMDADCGFREGWVFRKNVNHFRSCNPFSITRS